MVKGIHMNSSAKKKNAAGRKIKRPVVTRITLLCIR